jgi:hypothetical protein
MNTCSNSSTTIIRNLMKLSSLLLAVTCLFTLQSCEDVIDLDSGFQTEELVVDAWLTNELTEQNILINYTTDFFNTGRPRPEDNARVTIIKGEQIYEFTHQGNGRYTYQPQELFGENGEQLELRIELGEETYVSKTRINRVPEPDSLIFIEERNIFNGETESFAEFFATDFSGTGDCYWIKSRFNDTLLINPIEINLAFDATFSPGTSLDGIQFIRPLRLGINPRNENNSFRPLEQGDKISVELHAISLEAFNFLDRAREQAGNGNNGLFAVPAANSPGNIRNMATGKSILGVFSIANVRYIEAILDK